MVGCFVFVFFLPPPFFLMFFGVGWLFFSSFMPVVIVVREAPLILLTSVIPPCPQLIASFARNCRHSRSLSKGFIRRIRSTMLFSYIDDSKIQ